MESNETIIFSPGKRVKRLSSGAQTLDSASQVTAFLRRRGLSETEVQHHVSRYKCSTQEEACARVNNADVGSAPSCEGGQNDSLNRTSPIDSLWEALKTASESPDCTDGDVGASTFKDDLSEVLASHPVEGLPSMLQSQTENLNARASEDKRTLTRKASSGNVDDSPKATEVDSDSDAAKEQSANSTGSPDSLMIVESENGSEEVGPASSEKRGEKSQAPPTYARAVKQEAKPAVHVSNTRGGSKDKSRGKDISKAVAGKAQGKPKAKANIKTKAAPRSDKAPSSSSTHRKVQHNIERYLTDNKLKRKLEDEVDGAECQLIKIHVVDTAGKQQTVAVPFTETVAQLKSRIGMSAYCGTRLTFEGKILRNNRSLQDCSVHSGATLKLEHIQDHLDEGQETKETNKFEKIQPLPWSDARKDPLFHCRVAKCVDGRTVYGLVVGIDIGSATNDRLYRIKYSDDDQEHMLEQQVLKVKVSPVEYAVSQSPRPHKSPDVVVIDR